MFILKNRKVWQPSFRKNKRIMDESETVWKESSWPNQGIIQTFPWNNLEKLRVAAVRKAGFPGEIRSKYLPEYDCEALPIHQSVDFIGARSYGSLRKRCCLIACISVLYA
jgi:hypothetical protein